MASLTNDPGDRKRITIDLPGGKRQTIRLGKMPERTADDYRKNIEHLHVNRNSRHLIATKVLEWANGLDDTLYERIARVGLLPARESEVVAMMTLGEFLDKWSSAQAFKPNTEIFYRNTKRLLLSFFGKDCDIVTIRAENADAFKAFMAKEHHLSAATVGRRIGAARTMWKAAMRWELVTRNPFDGIPVGTQSNAARKRFISRDIIAKVIDAAPDAEWRLIIALSRYAGLRCPSEHYALTWRDVNWEAGTITVNCPKLARNPKFARRVIPLFAELRPYLMQVFEEAEDGAEHVIARHRLASVNLRTRFLHIIQAAGVLPWPRLFQNLRASRESELMREYDLSTACEWIGNSPKIAAEHYAVAVEKDADFKRAVGLVEGPEVAPQKATRFPTRKGVNLGVIEGDREPAPVAKTAENTGFPEFSAVGGWAEPE